jgi:hypothetical protein
MTPLPGGTTRPPTSTTLGRVTAFSVGNGNQGLTLVQFSA